MPRGNDGTIVLPGAGLGAADRPGPAAPPDASSDSRHSWPARELRRARTARGNASLLKLMVLGTPIYLGPAANLTHLLGAGRIGSNLMLSISAKKRMLFPSLSVNPQMRERERETGERGEGRMTLISQL